MSERPNHGDRWVRYLLGDLSEEATEALERGYVVREDGFEALLAEEEELFDAYVEERLPEPERRRFEERFLSTAEGRERVAWVRAFHRLAATGARTAARPRILRSVARGLLAASVLLALGGGVWWADRSRLLYSELTQVAAAREVLERQIGKLSQEVLELRREAEQQQRRVAQLTEELALERARAPVERVVSWVLLPGLTRDLEGPPTSTLLAGVEQVRLRLLLDVDSYPTYRASIETAEGREVAAQAGLRSRPAQGGRAVDLRIAAKNLAPGGYVARLRGATVQGTEEEVDIYHFRVRSEP